MILIDMEMPEKCGLCPLFHAEHPMHCQGVKADRKKKTVAPYGQPRPDWCPLHEVTADSIENNSIHLCDSCLNMNKYRYILDGITYFITCTPEDKKLFEARYGVHLELWEG